MASNKVSIAVLDDYSRVSEPHFQSLKDDSTSVTIFEDTLPAWTHSQTSGKDQDALIERLRPFTIISTMRERTPFPKGLLERLPNLKLLLCTGTQHSTFDVEAAKELKIPVATVFGRGRLGGASSKKKRQPRHPAVIHTWALILALCRNIAADDLSVKSGGWQTGMAVGLEGKTLGLVGLGRLGSSVAQIAAQTFDMRVIAWSENLTQDKADESAKRMGLPVDDEGIKTFEAVSKDRLFKEADVVSVQYVLSERSRGTVGRKELGQMKPSAMLVNTSRGALVDDEALLESLKRGQIRGAALDTFDIEPLPADSPWRDSSWGQNGRSRVLLSPHMGYVEESLINAFYAEQVEQIQRWLKGEEVLNRLD